MTKGERKSLEGFDVVFTSFEMGNHEETGNFRVGARS